MDHQCTYDDHGCAWDYDCLYQAGDERGERPDTFYGAVRCWKRIYDAADFCFDHSTAVNMVAAMVKRICSGLDKMKKETGTDEKRKIGTKEIVAAFICCVVDFGIAQFGLLTLIQKAYSVLAYLAIPVILIPYLIHMAVTRFDTK